MLQTLLSTSIRRCLGVEGDKAKLLVPLVPRLQLLALLVLEDALVYDAHLVVRSWIVLDHHGWAHIQWLTCLHSERSKQMPAGARFEEVLAFQRALPSLVHRSRSRSKLNNNEIREMRRKN